MTSSVKKTTVDEYVNTLITLTKNIDELFVEALNDKKNKKRSIWHGFENYYGFLKDVEKKALAKTCEETGLARSTVRDRWKTLMLPTPVYSAIEDGEITFSKAKLLTSINFDYENDNDIVVAEELVEAMKGGLTNPQIKELVKETGTKVWNHSTVVMSRMAEDHGITKDTIR